MPYPRNPPHHKTQILRYKFKLGQNFHFICTARNMGIWVSWFGGFWDWSIFGGIYHTCTYQKGYWQGHVHTHMYVYGLPNSLFDGCMWLLGRTCTSLKPFWYVYVPIALLIVYVLPNSLFEMCMWRLGRTCTHPKPFWCVYIPIAFSIVYVLPNSLFEMCMLLLGRTCPYTVSKGSLSTRTCMYIHVVQALHLKKQLRTHIAYTYPHTYIPNIHTHVQNSSVQIQKRPQYTYSNVYKHMCKIPHNIHMRAHVNGNRCRTHIFPCAYCIYTFPHTYSKGTYTCAEGSSHEKEDVRIYIQGGVES